MPGISQECEFGAHQTCGLGTECRCPCHSHTQALIQKGAGKPDPKGGLRRKKLKNLVTLPNGEIGVADVAAETVKCRCGNTSKPGDVYCRKCGTRLRGQDCERCGMPGETGDLFCGTCGWQFGVPAPAAAPTNTEALKRELRDKLAKAQASLTPPAPPADIETKIPEEDPIVRIRREAIEKGLMKGA